MDSDRSVAVRNEVEAILAKYPKLTQYGHGEIPLQYLRGGATRQGMRDALLEQGSVDAAAGVAAWASAALSKRKSVNSGWTSYSLKHVAERDIGYTTNGAFIVGMLLAGFRMTDNPGPNPSFNVAEAGG